MQETDSNYVSGDRNLLKELKMCMSQMRMTNDVFYKNLDQI